MQKHGVKSKKHYKKQDYLKIKLKIKIGENRMYRLKLTGILSCLMVLMFFTTVWAKDRVAIMDFENKSQHGGWRLGRGASDILTTELVKTGKFNVMERDTFAAIIKEQNLGASGRIDPSTAARIGKSWCIRQDRSVNRCKNRQNHRG
jgi:curli biogenesis system outer membrane secretion channel CsgG